MYSSLPTYKESVRYVQYPPIKSPYAMYSSLPTYKESVRYVQ